MFVTIKGSVIKMLAATGTEDEEREKTKIKMRATTGVARKMASGRESRSFIHSNFPQKKPRMEPKKSEIKKADSTLKNVAERWR